jgi:hypothetical protein
MASDNDCTCDLTPVREDISEAQKLLDQRRAVYGDRIDNMVRVAQMWGAFLGVEIQPWQVPVMFALYKIYRLGITPDYSDNVDDVDGYMLMFREVIGDKLIQARTVEEYLAELNARAASDPRLQDLIMETDQHIPGQAMQAEGEMLEGWAQQQTRR